MQCNGIDRGCHCCRPCGRTPASQARDAFHRQELECWLEPQTSLVNFAAAIWSPALLCPRTCLPAGLGTYLAPGIHRACSPCRAACRLVQSTRVNEHIRVVLVLSARPRTKSGSTSLSGMCRPEVNSIRCPSRTLPNAVSPRAPFVTVTSVRVENPANHDGLGPLPPLPRERQQLPPTRCCAPGLHTARHFTWRAPQRHPTTTSSALARCKHLCDQIETPHPDAYDLRFDSIHPTVQALDTLG